MNELSLQVKELIKDISSTFLTVNLYTAQHPQAKNSIKMINVKLKEIFKTQNEISFGIAGEELFFQKHVFFDLTEQLKDFIRKLKERNIEYIKFENGLTKEELEEFFSFLSTQVSSISSDKQKIVLEKKFTHIEIGRFSEAQGYKVYQFGDKDLNKELKVLNNIYDNCADKSKNLLESMIKGEKIDYNSVMELANRILDLSDQHRNLLFILMGIKKHDDFTFVHCLNVAILAMFQAKNLGLPQEKIVQLGSAGFLHDIGKIAVKKLILEKKDRFTKNELEDVRNHVILGSKLLLQSAHFSKLAFITSFQHHLGFNLKGYPKVRFLKKQNLASKLITISDVYDALRSRRSYKESIPLEKAYEVMMKNSGKLFDPQLLELFFKYMGIWPAGTLVRLDSGEAALVVENNPNDITRPKVEVFFDANGERFPRSFIIDLTEKDEAGNFRKRILRHLNPYGEGQKFISELFGNI